MALNKIIHEQSRLKILTFLAGRKENDVSFNELQDKLGFTSGNLSVQLKKLDEAEYVTIEKIFKDNKPHTTTSITREGRKALEEYIQEMDEIIQSLRS